ncbi:MAG: trigger factor [Candidatus Magasanikbacteria bacterium]
MEHKIEKLEKSQIELTITVSPKDYQKHLEKAATTISNRVAIRGFRKGKAPFEMVKQEVGEMKLLQEALEDIIQDSFYQTVTAEKLNTIGMPDINIQKMAPANDLVYSAKVALLPKVELPKLESIKIKRTVKEVNDQSVNETIDNLLKMQAKEVIKKGKATKEDKIVIDMNLFLDGVPVEGGQAIDYNVYLSEDHQHIPGFNDALIGLEKGDEKEFDLPFPKNYYSAQLAGKTGKFKVKVKEVFGREIPKADDAFAKVLGQESLDKLKDLIKENLTHEAEHKADEIAEIEMFETLIKETKFEEIPEVLVEAELKKMFYELQHDLEKHGVTIEQYLQDIKKNEKELQEDFRNKATDRAKASLLSREVALAHSLTISKDELDAEVKNLREYYKETAEYLENLKKPEVLDSIHNMLLNKKVVNFLADKLVEGERHKHEEHSHGHAMAEEDHEDHTGHNH